MGSATDSGDPNAAFTYTWSAQGPSAPNGTPGVVFDDASSANATARFPGGPGSYTLTLEASDASGSAQSSMQVTVQSNTLTYPAPVDVTQQQTCDDTSSGWQKVDPSAQNMDAAQLTAAQAYADAQTTETPPNDAGFITRNGLLVYCWGNYGTRFDMQSSTKSIGGLALLLAIDDGKLSSNLSESVSTVLAPSPMVFGVDPAIDTSQVANGATELNSITVFQLATHTSGLSKSDNSSDGRSLLYAPGTEWSYSDQGLNWLADTLTWTYGQDLNALLTNRVFNTIGIDTLNLDDLVWRSNQYRTPTITINGTPGVARRELGSGIQASVNAMARVGLLMLRNGVWGDHPLLSNAVVAEVTRPPAQNASLAIADPANYPGATTNYGILWWTNAGCQMPNVPKDTYFSWGQYETLIIVIPSLNVVAAYAGDHAWNADATFWNGDYTRLEPFFQDIVKSVTDNRNTAEQNCASP